MTTTIRKEFRFEAAHQLPFHDGKCARLHGHSWKLTVELEGEVLVLDGPKRGMLADFGEVKSAVQPFVDAYLDHHHLNVSTPLESPTSEAIAAWVFEALETEVLPQHLRRLLKAVEIDETCTSKCRVERGQR